MLPACLASTYWERPFPPQDTQYDETLVTYKNDAHAEVALSAHLYELNKDWPLTGQYTFSIPIVVAANSRRNMEYTAESYATGNIYIYDVHTLTLGDNEGAWVDINYEAAPFLFYGAWYTKVFITSNGFVTFDSRAYNDNGGKWTSPNPASIPTTDDPNAILAPFWRDLDPSKGGTIEYGTGLYNDFAVVWRNIPNKANSNTQTFALYLSRYPTPEHSCITFIYGSITNDVPTSIGIEDQTGKQGVPVASMSSGKIVDFAVDNDYWITKIKVSISKLTAGGANDEEARIYIQGWEESRPGGVNVILEDPSEGKYDTPQIVKTAAFALGTAGLLSGYAFLGVAGYVLSAGIFAYELSPMPRGTTVHEAMEPTETAYVKSAARDENYPLYNWAHDVSISPLILWQINEPWFNRLLITAEVSIKRPDGTTYTLTTDNIELKLTRELIKNWSFESRDYGPPYPCDGVFSCPPWETNNGGWRELPGDCAPEGGDGLVDMEDITIVAVAFGSKPGYPGWNPDADLNGDGIVDIEDMVIASLDFGKKANRIDGSYSWYTSGGGDYKMWQELDSDTINKVKGNKITFTFWFLPESVSSDGLQNYARAEIHYWYIYDDPYHGPRTAVVQKNGDWVYPKETKWHSAVVTTFTIPSTTYYVKVVIHGKPDFKAWIDVAF